jgi:hypothetical protein
MRQLVVASSLFMCACTSSMGPDPEIDEGDAVLPRACEGESCADGRACEWGVCVGGAGDLSPDVDAAVRSIVRRGCARVHGECSAICDNPFVECFASVDACADAWAADYVEDFDFPLLDPVLAANCAAQVDVASCNDVSPDTLECEYALVESCPGDGDDLGSPYSPFRAAAIASNGTVTVHLCEDVEEYYAVYLEEGDSLSVTSDRSLGLELYRLIASSRGEAVLEMISYVNPDGDATPAIASSGVYLLEARSGSATARYSLTLSTSIAPAD